MGPTTAANSIANSESTGVSTINLARKYGPTPYPPLALELPLLLLLLVLLLASARVPRAISCGGVRVQLTSSGGRVEQCAYE